MMVYSWSVADGGRVMWKRWVKVGRLTEEGVVLLKRKTDGCWVGCDLGQQKGGLGLGVYFWIGVGVIY